jgi:arsenate reductase
MINIYGIKNCDTMKRALKWLADNSIAFQFHDYKKLGIDQETLAEWLKKAPWDELINRRGTTWRQLPDDLKTDITNDKAISLMLANTSLIKRPVLIVNNELYLGFKDESYAKIFIV